MQQRTNLRLFSKAMKAASDVLGGDIAEGTAVALKAAGIADYYDPKFWGDRSDKLSRARHRVRDALSDPSTRAQEARSQAEIQRRGERRYWGEWTSRQESTAEDEAAGGVAYPGRPKGLGGDVSAGSPPMLPSSGLGMTNRDYQRMLDRHYADQRARDSLQEKDYVGGDYGMTRSDGVWQAVSPGVRASRAGDPYSSDLFWQGPQGKLPIEHDEDVIWKTAEEILRRGFSSWPVADWEQKRYLAAQNIVNAKRARDGFWGPGGPAVPKKG